MTQENLLNLQNAFWAWISHKKWVFDIGMTYHYNVSAGTEQEARNCTYIFDMGVGEDFYGAGYLHIIQGRTE